MGISRGLFPLTPALVALLLTGSIDGRASAAEGPAPGNTPPALVGADYKGQVDAETQRQAALGVIRRLLGETSSE